MPRLMLVVAVVAGVVALAGCGGGGDSSGPARYTYLSADNLSPGAILRVDGAAERTVLTRPTDRLTGFVLGGPTVTAPALPPDWCYFCDALDGRTICRADSTIVYTHSTFLRDLAVGHDGALYFSESHGGGADGKIYRFDAAGVAHLYYTVALAQVGFFAGGFGFSPDGTLYISNGNINGAGLWRCPVGGGAPTKVFGRTDNGSVAGFYFSDNSTVLFTDYTNKLRRATVGGGTVQTAFTTVFTSPSPATTYSDVVQSATLYPTP